MIFELLLSKRFLFGSKNEKNISSMVKLCLISIFVGIFSLTLILAITNGFEEATHKKLQSIHSDLIIHANGQSLNFDKINQVIKSKYKNKIIGISPTSTYQAMVANKERNNLNSIVVLKAINPSLEEKVNTLKSTIIYTHKNKDWSELLKNSNILVGYNLAKNLKLRLGQTIKILYPDDENNTKKIDLNIHEAKVVGIFKTGINEFDEQVALTSFDLFENVFDKKANQINIKLNKNVDEKKLVSRMEKQLNLNVISWKDLYPAIVSALSLEKKAITIILILVAIIASMNLISLLYMLILQKREQIAILKSMGMTNKSLKLVFILFGLMITLTASIFGTFAGWIASLIINNYKLIKLPDAYYISYLPANINFPSIVLILLFSLILTAVISIIPTKKVKSINLANILKSKGI